MLSNFHIENFRGFKNLSLETLGRVNLIVGKNSVGKSSVLEALRIYASDADPRILRKLASDRDEHRSSRTASSPLLSLFHDGANKEGRFTLGPKESPLELSLQLSANKVPGHRTIFENVAGDSIPLNLVVRSPRWNDTSLSAQGNSILPGLAARMVSEQLERMRTVYVSANGLTHHRTAELWDQVALSSLEEDVTASLRLIIPGLERVSLIGGREGRENESGRVPFAKLRGKDLPIPLKRLGDGVVRLFGITLALVTAQDGMLLIDEIENGIHYSVQPALWNFLLEVSRRLNVQVFATSHSWDCLKAFQEASSRDTNSDGVLTRLEEFRGAIRATQFTEPELEIATTEGIEIR